MLFLGDYFEKMWPSRENSEIKGESRFCYKRKLKTKDLVIFIKNLKDSVV